MTTTEQKDQAQIDLDLSIINNIAKFGYAFVGVNDIDDVDPVPAYVYTVGLFRKGMPELFISGNMEQKTAMEIINKVITMWEKDGKVRVGRINNFLKVVKKKMPIQLVHVDANLCKARMIEVSKLFPSQAYDVVQIFWPDEKGYLPYEDSYTKEPSHHQHALRVD
jgi:hypothetical protein